MSFSECLAFQPAHYAPKTASTAQAISRQVRVELRPFEKSEIAVPISRFQIWLIVSGICLTTNPMGSNLIKVRVAKPIIVGVLMAVLAVYTADCTAATSTQAMQCCKTMQCRSSHMTDCCKLEAAVRADLGQPSSVDSSFHLPTVIALFTSNLAVPAAEPGFSLVALRSHAPPGSFSSAPIPIRI